MKKLVVLILMLAAALLTGCSSRKIRDDDPRQNSYGSQQADESAVSLPTTSVQPIDIDDGQMVGSFYGSYLTMFLGEKQSKYPYVKLLDSYKDVEDYFFECDKNYFLGKRFTLACASFTDDFLAENDLLMLVICEPSTYASYTADGIRISGSSAQFDVIRHIPENAPRGDDVIYHLIFTAPKGYFSAIDTDSVTVSVTEKITDENTDVYDAEKFRYIYPEFWPYTHKADAKDENAAPVISSIHSYDELVGFYEGYKNTFDLDSDFVRYIGPVYYEDMFDDYVLLLAALPFDSRLPKPSVSEVFVYNLNIWITISNYSEEIPQEYTKWYLMAVAVIKKDLEGVKLNEFYIG